jgi:cholest-4-en-3-one 26-monooxygenase
VPTLAVDLSDPDVFADGIPHELFTQMRAADPVHWNAMPDEPGFWAVTRHDDIAAISRDTDTFSSWEGGTMIRDDAVVPLDIWRNAMLNMDPPQHTEYRALVNTVFTARHVADLEPHIRAIARRLIDAAVAKGEFDVVEDIAVPLPLQVIAEMLGVDEVDYPKLVDFTSRAAGFDDRTLRGAGEADGMQVFLDGMAFFHEIGQQRLREPQDDLVTALQATEVEGRKLTEIELTAFLGLLAVGGTDTTRNSFAGGMLALIEHPDQRRRLLDDPSLIAPAVEEVIRWVTPFTHFRRTATRDAEIRGVPVAAGDKVVMWYASSNRDEAVFEDPFAFDVGRDPNRHQGFGGGGKHFCLGAGLARLELKVLLEEALARMPELELAGPVRRVRSAWLTALHQLPVRPA